MPISFAIKRNKEWVEIAGAFQSGEGDDAVNHPVGWLEATSDKERAAVGVVAIVEPTPPAPGLRVIGSRLLDHAGVPTRIYDTEPSPAAVPQTVTPRQLRLALLGAGKLAQVQALIDSGQAPPEAVISWEYATEFLRTDPMLNQLASAVQPSLTSDEIDQLFVAAAQIP